MIKFNKLVVKKNKKAVTLVELLIVVGIVSIISLAIIPSYADFSQKKDFNNKVEIFIAELMNVRNKALAGAVASDGTEVYWGLQPKQECQLRVYFLGYKTSPTSSTFVVQSTQTLPEGVTFKSTNYPNDCNEVIFERLKGTPIFTGGVTEQRIILQYKNLTRTIRVNSAGRISYD